MRFFVLVAHLFLVVCWRMQQLILRGLLGDFSRDSGPVEGAEECGFTVSCGPKFFDELVTEMANDVLELNNASAKVLYNGFAKGFQDLDKGNRLTLLSDTEDLLPWNEPAKNEEIVISRVSVNETTAVCPRTGVKLRLLKLGEEERHQVHDTLLEMASSQYEEFQVKLKARHKQNMEEVEGSEYAVGKLSNFSKWLKYVRDVSVFGCCNVLNLFSCLFCIPKQRERWRGIHSNCW